MWVRQLDVRHVVGEQVVPHALDGVLVVRHPTVAPDLDLDAIRPEQPQRHDAARGVALTHRVPVAGDHEVDRQQLDEVGLTLLLVRVVEHARRVGVGDNHLVLVAVLGHEPVLRQRGAGGDLADGRVHHRVAVVAFSRERAICADGLPVVPLGSQRQRYRRHRGSLELSWCKPVEQPHRSSSESE